MAKPKANDLVDMDSFGGRLADGLPGSFGASRAGRSTAMAKSVGEEPSAYVESPLRSELFTDLGGAAAGAAAGLAYDSYSGDKSGRGLPYGALGGLAAGSLLAYILRRSAMNRTNEKFDKAKKIKPQPADAPGFFQGLITPYAGPHHLGEAKAVEALRGNMSAEQAAGGEGVKNTLRTLLYPVPYAGAITNVGLGYYDNIKSNDVLGAEKAARQGRPLK